MSKESGTSIKKLKIKNRTLLLKLIATQGSLSRVDLSRLTGLTKMAIGNLVSELIEENLIEEDSQSDNPDSSTSQGRPPIKLKISSASPCFCGMLVKRGLCEVAVSDLSGIIFDSIKTEFTAITGEGLVKILTDSFASLKARTNRHIYAIGVSSIGPINSTTGEILNPPNSPGIENIAITEKLRKALRLPVFLINDANAGALAEKMYGLGKDIHNFVYIHIMNGIGAGLVLEDKLYEGNSGQSGEIGHTSINFTGPRCSCGNTGCLELYASVQNMQNRISQLKDIYPGSELHAFSKARWINIVDAANGGDPLALHVLEEFCSYISYALIDVLNMIDTSHVFIGYNSSSPGDTVERLLESRISQSVLYSKYRDISVRRSAFQGNGPLVGSIAMIADKIFNHELEL